MDAHLTALERAFELARSGKCYNLVDIALTLRSEGYLTAVLEGPVLKSQLRRLIAVATKRDVS